MEFMRMLNAASSGCPQVSPVSLRSPLMCITQVSPVAQVSPVTPHVTQVSPVTPHVTQVSPVTPHVTQVSPVSLRSPLMCCYVAI
eukprot:1094793-Pelagomonas_calceolata.AAC.1